MPSPSRASPWPGWIWRAWRKWLTACSRWPWSARAVARRKWVSAEAGSRPRDWRGGGGGPGGLAQPRAGWAGEGPESRGWGAGRATGWVRRLGLAEVAGVVAKSGLLEGFG